jgi:hypothetical protein
VYVTETGRLHIAPAAPALGSEESLVLPTDEQLCQALNYLILMAAEDLLDAQGVERELNNREPGSEAHRNATLFMFNRMSTLRNLMNRWRKKRPCGVGENTMEMDM